MGRRRVPRKNVYINESQKFNALFEQYYKGQGIVSEEEWEEFVNVLKKDLPITFRVTGFRDQNKQLLEIIKNKFCEEVNQLRHILTDKEDVSGSLTSMCWYPGEVAWQLDVSKYTVRKTEALKALQQFLVSESESGNISRQEAVSMLPPLLMNLKSHHVVLDTCAAPGSKSAQIVELLHADAETKEVGCSSYSEPSGILIANDVEQKRCYLMVHQVKRLQSPCVLITQEDATCFPRLYIPKDSNQLYSNENVDDIETKQLLFDRILADVPCSGDGTLRKNQDLWTRWTPSLGVGEHALQMQILRRSLELLRNPDDEMNETNNNDDDNFPRLVYSTCSLNPMEDEAVVGQILQKCQGAVRLVEPDFFECIDPVTKQMDGDSTTTKFKARPGLKTWRVMNKNGTWYSSYDQVPDKEKSYLYPTLFPPSNAEDLHLEYCRRIMPHDQNTGGFFVAVMIKVSPLPWMKAPKTASSVKSTCGTGESVSSAETAEDVNGPEISSKVNGEPVMKRQRIFNENPFRFIDFSTDSNWQSICDYFQLRSDDHHTKLNMNNILRRSQDSETIPRHFYYTNSLIKQLITLNAHKGIKFVNTGVKIFSMIDDKLYHGYRLLQEGIELADHCLPPTGGRRIRLTSNELPDLVILLEQEMPLISTMSEAIQSQCENLTPGPVLIQYDPDQGVTKNEGGPNCRLLFAGWRGLKSLRHYTNKFERAHFMRLVGIEPKSCT